MINFFNKSFLLKNLRSLNGKFQNRLESTGNGKHTWNTIFSLSSGSGKCGVAVVRVSGPKSFVAIQKIAQFPNVPKPRYAYLKRFWHPKSGELIDKGLLLWFPGPHSFTGEDSCEFQVHGGPAILTALFDALQSIEGLRLAKPGEFTKRAFYGGKLDLTEVEGLSDLIHAETEMQRKQALLQLDGLLSKLYTNWRQRLLKCIAHIEAYIDFSEDQNIEDNVLDVLKTELNSIKSQIISHLKDDRRGEIMRQGCRAVIVGAPNVGKSSLMNKLCGQSVSIVTDIAGTTRDVIEKPFNIAGYPIIFTDTAGLRKTTNDPVEFEGISRAHLCTEAANLVILVIDAVLLKKYDLNLNQCKIEYMKEMGLDPNTISEKNLLIVVNKIDLLDNSESQYLKSDNKVCYVSCLDDIPDAVNMISSYLQNLCGIPSENSPNLSQQRHRHLLTQCLESIMAFENFFNENDCPDYAIAAQDLRNGLRSLAQITGEVSTEEILDVIFKDFCIGK